MANEFQSVASGGGLLKNDYDDGDSPLSRALRLRRAKLGNKIVVPTQEDLEATGGKDE